MTDYFTMDLTARYSDNEDHQPNKLKRELSYSVNDYVDKVTHHLIDTTLFPTKARIDLFNNYWSSIVYILVENKSSSGGPALIAWDSNDMEINPGEIALIPTFTLSTSTDIEFSHASGTAQQLEVHIMGLLA